MGDFTVSAVILLNKYPFCPFVLWIYLFQKDDIFAFTYFVETPRPEAGKIKVDLCIGFEPITLFVSPGADIQGQPGNQNGKQ